MFKIARIAKEIIRSARNMNKCCSQSKGYIEEAGNEFTFLKASIKPVIQDNLKVFTPNFTNIARVKTMQLLYSADIRKLIYSRFVDEIVAKTKKITDTVATNDITEEFKMFKEQGYDFAATRAVLQNRDQETNQNQEANKKNLVERMKELSISGYLSNYAGHPQLREDIEKVIIQKDLVINEFMATVTSSIEEPEEYSTELLG